MLLNIDWHIKKSKLELSGKESKQSLGQKAFEDKKD